MWKNNGKLKKQKKCKPCKEQKWLFKMDTQTKIYVTHNDLVAICKSKVA